MLIDFRLLWSRRRHEGKVAAEPGGHRVIYWQLLQPLCAALLVVLVAACKTSTGLAYKPPFIPVTFSINNDWQISVTVGASITSFLGTFSLESGISASLANDSTRLLIIRTVNGAKQELAYDIHERGPMTLCINGQIQESIGVHSVVVTPLSAPSQVDLLPSNASTCHFTPAPVRSTRPAVTAPTVATTKPAATVTSPTATKRPTSPIPQLFSLRNYNSSYCVGITGGYDDAPAIQWDCVGAQNQIWRMGNEFGNTGYYQIINGNGECLGVGGGSSDEGVAIYGWECTGTGYPDQYWRLAEYGNSPYYYLVNYNSGQVMGVLGNSAAEGDAIVQWPNQNTMNNQLWRPISPPA